MNLVFFLEEASAREMLKGLLPRIFGTNAHSFRYIVFEGKQDLEKQIVGRMRGYKEQNCRFVVLRDQDSGKCEEVKSGLVKLCNEAGRNDSLIRVACRELESWYPGDLAAVERALGKKVSGQQQKSKFRNPDRLSNPAQELEKLTDNTYQKVSGSRAISPHLSLTDNRSHSFSVFVAAMQRLATEVRH